MSRNLIALTERLAGGRTAYELLGEARERHGRIDAATVDALARATGLPAQHLLSIAAFYDELAPDRGRPARVKACDGEACRVAGADALAEDLRGRLEGRLGSVTCLGLCSRGPMLAVDGRAVPGDRADDVVAAIEAGQPLAPGEVPENPIHAPEAGRPRILLGRMLDAPGMRASVWPAEGYAALEKARAMAPRALIAEIEESGLPDFPPAPSSPRSPPLARTAGASSSPTWTRVTPVPSSTRNWPNATPMR